MEQAKWRIREWFPQLEQRVLERLRIYHLELLRWTKKINLIAPSTADEADFVHFADSLMGVDIVLKHLGSLGPVKEVWDIGSGNGFPGVVLSIMRPDLGVICLDSDERKIAFIKQLSLRLELEDLAARCERIEKIPSGAIQCAVTRGFAPLGKALMYCQTPVAPGGSLFHFKGFDWSQELNAVPVAMSAAWHTELVEEYKITFDKAVSKPPARAILCSKRL